MAAQTVKRRDGLASAGTVHHQSAVPLELLQGGRRIGTQNSIDAADIEAKLGQQGLKIGYIVAPKVGRCVEEDTVAQSP